MPYAYVSAECCVPRYSATVCLGLKIDKGEKLKSRDVCRFGGLDSFEIFSPLDLEAFQGSGHCVAPQSKSILFQALNWHSDLVSRGGASPPFPPRSAHMVRAWLVSSLTSLSTDLTSALVRHRNIIGLLYVKRSGSNHCHPKYPHRALGDAACNRDGSDRARSGSVIEIATSSMFFLSPRVGSSWIELFPRS